MAGHDRTPVVTEITIRIEYDKDGDRNVLTREVEEAFQAIADSVGSIIAPAFHEGITPMPTVTARHMYGWFELPRRAEDR